MVTRRLVQTGCGGRRRFGPVSPLMIGVTELNDVPASDIREEIRALVMPAADEHETGSEPCITA